MDVVLVHALQELRQVRTNMACEFVVCVMILDKELADDDEISVMNLTKPAISFPGSPDLRNQCEPENQRQTHSRLCSAIREAQTESDSTRCWERKGNRHYLVLNASTRDGRGRCHWEDTVAAVVATKG